MKLVLLLIFLAATVIQNKKKLTKLLLKNNIKVDGLIRIATSIGKALEFLQQIFQSAKKYIKNISELLNDKPEANS